MSHPSCHIRRFGLLVLASLSLGSLASSLEIGIREGGGKLRVGWNTHTAGRYQLQIAHDLTQLQWADASAFPFVADGDRLEVELDCGCAGGPGEGAQARFLRVKELATEPHPFAALDGVSSSATIEAEAGGTLSVTNRAGDVVTLTIPPGALPFSTAVSLKAFVAAPDQGFATTTFPGVWIEPHGLILSRPAHLRIALAAPGDDPDRNLLVYTDAGLRTHPLASEWGEAILSATLDHFSSYTGIWPSAEEAQAAADELVYASLDPCADSQTRIKGLVEWAGYFERAGNLALQQYYMGAALGIIEADLTAVIGQPIPDPMGRLCTANPTKDYIQCLLRLAEIAELFGSNLMDDAMDRVREAVDLWSGQLAATAPPEEAQGRCVIYIPCVWEVLAFRELLGMEHGAIDSTLETRLEEARAMGCEQCSVKWMARARFTERWTNYTGTVSLGGKAQWSRFNLILDRDDLEEACVSINEGRDSTFPNAAYLEPLRADASWLTDADPEFATAIERAELLISWGGDDLDQLELTCSMSFNGSTAGATIPLESYRSAIERRRPFSVHQDLSHPDSPSYSGSIEITFIPIRRGSPAPAQAVGE